MKYNSFLLRYNHISNCVYTINQWYLESMNAIFQPPGLEKSIFQHNKSKHSASNMAIDYHIHKYILIIAQDSSVMIWYTKISITSYCTHFLMIYNKATTYKSIDLYIYNYIIRKYVNVA